MKTEHHNQCPICGARQRIETVRCKDRTASGETFALEKCNVCTLISTRNAPTTQAMERYYDNREYTPHAEQLRGTLNRIYSLARRLRMAQKARLTERKAGTKRGKMMDYGCGTGDFAHTMKTRGWDVTAIDADPKARRTADRRFGLNTRTPEALKEIPNGSLDAVTMWHVMEHVEDLEELWSETRRALKTGGVLIVAVPNPTSADAEICGADWAAYDVPRHRWHFTPEAMRRMAHRQGFGLEEIRPTWLDAWYICLLTEKQRGRTMPLARGLWTGIRATMKRLKDPMKSSALTYVMRKTDREEGGTTL